MTDQETIQRLCDSVDALMSEKLHTRITKLEDKGVEQVIVDTIGPMLDRITALEKELHALETASQAKIYNGPS